MPQHAAIYCRISQDRQGTELGVQRQETMCRELAERLGWTVAEVYVDNDASAFDRRRRRPEFDRLLEDLRSGRRDGMLIADVDRLSRQPRQGEDLIDLVESSGIKIANASGMLDLSTPMGRMGFRQGLVWAAAESEQKSERIRRERDQRARAGRPHPSPRRFGWNADMTALDPSESALVREGVDQLLAGASYRSVAVDWNERGVRSVAGNRWTTASVRGIFTNPRLCGLRVHRGEVFGEGVWPPIIDRVTFERLQAVERVGHAKPGRPAAHLLTGLLVCGRCGCGMVAGGHMHSKSPCYACRRQPGGVRDGACGRMQIAGPHSEEWIVKGTLHRLGTPGFVEAVGDVGDTAGRAAAVEQLQAAEDRLSEIADMFGAGELDRAAYLKARARAEEVQAKARGAVDAHVSTSVLDGMPTNGDLRGWWEGLGLDRKRAVLAAVLEEIVVLPFDPTGPRRFQPDRLAPKWRA